MPFDPYQKWLGIQVSERPLSHYQLLGLTDLESNAQFIAQAADTAMARVRRIRPGDQMVAWQQLLDEISAAKQCLLDPLRKARYDAELGKRTASKSRPAGRRSEAVRAETDPLGDLLPPTAVGPVESSSPDLPAGDPMAPVAAYVPPQAVPNPVPASAMVPPVQVVQPLAGQPYYSAGASQTAPLAPVAPVFVAVPVTPVAMAAAPAVAPVSVVQAGGESALSAEDWTSGSSARMSYPRRRRASDSGIVWGALGGIALIGLAIVALVIGKLKQEGQGSPDAIAQRPAKAQQPSAPATSQPKVRERGEPGDVARGTKSDAVAPSPPPMPAGDQAELSGAVNDKPVAVPTPDPEGSPVAQAPPAPMQPEPAPMPAKEPDPAQKAAFEKGVQTVRAALGARDLERAKRELDLVEKSVVSPEQEQRFVQIAALYDAVDGFWNAVGESLKGLQPADELKIGSTVLAIVEVSPDSLTIRGEGLNRSYPIAKLPAGIALALAERWFEENEPSTKVFLGAFHLVEPTGNRAEAQRLWEEATRAGAATSNLMPLLEEETAALPVEQGPLPDAKAQRQAHSEVRKTFAQEYRQARSPQQKLELARTLLNTASTDEEPARRFALLSQARDLAIAAADAAAAMAAVEEMVRRYEVDVWKLRSEALKRLSSNANGAAAAAVARSAMKLAAGALKENQFEPAEQLSRMALQAARKSQDQELIQEAMQYERQVREASSASPPDSE